MRKIFTFLMVFAGCFANGQPTVSNIVLDPGLNITHFSFYKATADINPGTHNINSVTLRVTPQNGDAVQSNWDFYTNGTPEPNPNTPLNYSMVKRETENRWDFSLLRPDDIYPEIFFASTDVTNADSPADMLINSRSYQLMHFQNPFTMGNNTSFFIEFYATPVSLTGPPSVDLQVYLVGKGKTSSFFQADWRDDPQVELVGTINKDRAFHHSHSDYSKHHLVPLSTNPDGTVGSKGIDINEDFWIVLYAPTHLASRSWNLKYHPGCTNNGNWLEGNTSGFTVDPRSGCPDVHIHVARNAAEGLKDGVKLEIIVDYDTQEPEVLGTKYFYFGEIPNLAPNASVITAPDPGTYSGNVTISWEPATDPNNDALTYNVKIVAPVTKTLVYAPVTGQGILQTTYVLDSSVPQLPDGSYDILIEACDGEFCTPFYWSSNVSEGAEFVISNVAPNVTWTGNVSSDWADSGNWMGNVIPGPASTVTIGPSPYNPVISGSSTIQDLVIESLQGLTIGPLGELTVTGTLVNNAGAAGLIIQSASDGTGSLVHQTPNVPATIERHITGSSVLTDMHYKTVSVPLNMDAEPVSGLFMGSYLYQFNAGTQAWGPMGSATTTILDVDRGYMIYYPNSAGTTYSFAGPMNNGSFEIPVSYNTTTEYSGFNLVPNPYPSALDWDAGSGWNKTNLNNSIWIWNPVEKQYAAYVDGTTTNGGTPIIPVGQSFFVQANAATPVLSVDNGARVHNDQAFFKESDVQSIASADELLRIRTLANNYSDEIVVRFLEEATPQHDSRFDAVKMYGSAEAPQIYSQAADGQKLSIYSHPHPTENISIPLGFELEEGETAKLEFEGMDSFDAEMQLLLEDLLEDVVIDLRTESAYNFAYEPGLDPNRFVLHMQVNLTTSTDPLPEETPFRIFAANRHIHLSVPSLAGQTAVVEVFDLLGRRQQHHKVELGAEVVLGTGSFNGVAIVRVVAGQQVFTQRVIIK
jgi:hypothetical protein